MQRVQLQLQPRRRDKRQPLPLRRQVDKVLFAAGRELRTPAGVLCRGDDIRWRQMYDGAERLHGAVGGALEELGVPLQQGYLLGRLTVCDQEHLARPTSGEHLVGAHHAATAGIRARGEKHVMAPGGFDHRYIKRYLPLPAGRIQEPLDSIDSSTHAYRL